MNRLVVVGGPTGTGKSDLAVELAHRLDGEVISADSMQMYRGMDIGTAKLSMAERQGVPHHLLDVLDVTDPASVAVYQQQARAIIEAILDRGKTPLLVGGSGLYIQAAIDEIAFPGTDFAIRSKYLALLDEVGPAELHRRLAALDPVAAAAVLPSNGRRIARALEVIELTGQPFTATMPTPGLPRYDAVVLTVDRPTPELDDRLALRVDQMMAAGFADEVRELLDRGLRQGSTARRAIGYAQLIDAIDGLSSMADAVTATVAATRRFVRRQRSWFRRDHRRHELDGTDPNLLATAIALVGQRGGQPSSDVGQ